MPTTEPYEIKDGHIENSVGEIAVGYYQPIPKQIQLINGHKYSFAVNRVSLGWIPPEDVQSILAIPYGCCGQKKTGAFFLANENYVRHFLNLELKGR